MTQPARPGELPVTTNEQVPASTWLPPGAREPAPVRAQPTGNGPKIAAAIALLAVIGAVIVFIASRNSVPATSTSKMLTKESFEAVVGTWPLRGDTAEIVCDPRNPSVAGVTTLRHTYYMSAAGESKGWEDPANAWAVDLRGVPKDHTDFVRYVQGQCRQGG